MAYLSLLPEPRRRLHARIVDAIETLYRDRLDEQIDRVAQHALQGGAWERAFSYNRRAGARAAGRSAYREAVVYLEQALTALEHLPQGRQSMGDAIDLRFDPTARHSPSPRAWGCVRSFGQAHLGLGAVYRQAWRPEESRTHLEAAHALFECLDMSSWRTRAAAELARVTDPLRA